MFLLMSENEDEKSEKKKFNPLDFMGQCGTRPKTETEEEKDK